MKKYNDFILEFADTKVSKRFDKDYEDTADSFTEFWTLLDDKLFDIKKDIGADEQAVFNSNEKARKARVKKPASTPKPAPANVANTATNPVTNTVTKPTTKPINNSAPVNNAPIKKTRKKVVTTTNAPAPTTNAPTPTTKATVTSGAAPKGKVIKLNPNS